MEYCSITIVTLLHIFTFSSADKAYLYKRPTEEKRWSDWITSSPARGTRGWYPLHDFYGNPEYRTCDVGHQQPNTWLRSNLISVPNKVKKVNITIEYRTVNCTTFRTTNFCREYFDFYVHQSTTLSAPDPLQSKATYEKIAEITLPTLGINARRHFGFQVKGKFIVLAFHNRGSCSNIHSVTVSYLVCPEITVVSGLVSLPRSVAPITNSVPVQGSCVTNAIYNKGILSLECKSDGVWNISSLKGRCTCREDTENSGGECKDCPSDKFNDQTGFNCTVIPSAPKIVQVIFINHSALELKWQPPATTGDQTQVFYDVECRKRCEGENDNKCEDISCGSDVIFIPKRDGLNMTCVTAGNLSPFVKYTVKIHARNRVSDLAKRKYGIEANFGEITVGTNGPESKVTLHLRIIYGLAGLFVVCTVFFACYIIYNRWNRQRNEHRAFTSVMENEAHWRDQHKLPLHGPSNRRRNAHHKKMTKLRDSRVVVNEDVAMSSVAERQKVDDFRLDRDQITTVKVLGSGNFSQVSKAVYKPLNSEVAVKSLKGNASKRDLEDMLTELDLMKILKPHPHVVELIGCCIEKDPLLVVLEYLPYGDLLGYLRKSRGIEDAYNTGERRPSSALTEKDLLSFAWMIADGMNYFSAMEARLPAKWMPPESLFHGKSSTKSDIWSYGIVMWEVFTIGESPYPGVKPKEIAGLLRTGYRMPKPSYISQELYSIMSNCWEEQPEKRPSFQWLCSAVKRLLDDHKTYVNLEVYDGKDYINFDMMMDEE
ncbi:ephrin type-A receptor 3 isoform X2 [Pocillopora verrucosa]|uniref:ephrin type-A receptor 3 isoform X2 n=1 Tax=Pocillopora verrucosa TaxID=203993 RepID=UPI00333E238F